MKSTITEPAVAIPMLCKLTPSMDVPRKREDRKLPNMLPRIPRPDRFDQAVAVVTWVQQLSEDSADETDK